MTSSVFKEMPFFFCPLHTSISILKDLFETLEMLGAEDRTSPPAVFEHGSAGSSSSPALFLLVPKNAE